MLWIQGTKIESINRLRVVRWGSRRGKNRKCDKAVRVGDTVVCIFDKTISSPALYSGCSLHVGSHLSATLIEGAMLMGLVSKADYEAWKIEVEVADQDQRLTSDARDLARLLRKYGPRLKPLHRQILKKNISCKPDEKKS